MHRRHAYLIAALCLAVVTALASQASAATIKGTVVHRNPNAGTFVVAGGHGHLSAIRSRARPREGSVVAVTARKLADGTFAGRQVRRHGRHRRARIRGVVTWTGHGGFTVSIRGASLLVRRADDDQAPQVGEEVDVLVTVAVNGDLDEDDLDQIGQAQQELELEGQVLSIDPSAGTITVAADDRHRSNGSVVVHVPDTSAFMVGDEVELEVSGPAADGSFTLVSADDRGDDRGDDHRQGSGDHSGPGGDDGSDQDGSVGSRDG